MFASAARQALSVLLKVRTSLIRQQDLSVKQRLGNIQTEETGQ